MAWTTGVWLIALCYEIYIRYVVKVDNPPTWIGVVHRLVHRMIAARGHPGVPKGLRQVAAHAEQDLVAVPMWLSLVDLDDGMNQPGVGSGEIGGAHRDDRTHRPVLAGEPPLLG